VATYFKPKAARSMSRSGNHGRRYIFAQDAPGKVRYPQDAEILRRDSELIECTANGTPLQAQETVTSSEPLSYFRRESGVASADKEAQALAPADTAETSESAVSDESSPEEPIEEPEAPVEELGGDDPDVEE